MESVLQYINRLNRNLESIIAVQTPRPTLSTLMRLLSCVLIYFFWGQVGNEFSSVEALWSQFENVMGNEEGQQQPQQQQGPDNSGEVDEEEEDDDDVDVKAEEDENER